MTMERNLAEIARSEAARCFHSRVMQTEANIGPILSLFPNWPLDEADGNWCAAFVYYCVVRAGYGVPRHPAESYLSLAGCGSWEEWARADARVEYVPAGTDYTPEAGDVVLFDRVFNGSEHDHVGIVLEDRPGSILVAEGNINNVSGIIEREKNAHIRAYIRIPDGFSYARE